MLRPASLAEVHALNADHAIEAAQVAEILSGEKGVRVHGAWIRGRLDLDGIDCAAGLRLTGTRVDSPAGAAALATGLVVDGSAFLETLDARGASPGGAVCFTGAAIGDDLVLQGARLIAGAGRRSTARSSSSRARRGRVHVGGLRLSTGFGVPLYFDGLSCAEDPVLLTGNPPTQVPEARQAAEWRVLLARSPGASARGMLTRLGRSLRLARAPHQAASGTVPFPRLAPPPAGTASP